MIEEYNFGVITIDDRSYNEDVEVRWTGEVLKWQREKNHIIDVEDIERAVEHNPDTIVIGTGESGMAEVTDEVQDLLNEKGIKLIVDMTEQATKTFNVINEESKEEEGKQDRVIGLFHLTC